MPQLGQRLQDTIGSRYMIGDEIGRGGTGSVFLAEDRKHRRRVAVKVLRPEVTSLVSATRFKREIETAAQLQHPHILPVYDSGEADGLLFYVTPFVGGKSLRDLLEERGPLPVEEALNIGSQVARALAFAHRNGVVHRDVKPANILISDNQAVVADFGIARALAPTSDLTTQGVALGTPLYMSPEQCMGAGEVGSRSDIYSLGCVLFEMLGGRPPFSGRTAQAALAAHISGTPPSLKVLRPSVPDRVEEAVMRSLAKLPADRYEDADQFAQVLEAKATTDAVQVVRRSRRGPILATGLTLVAALGAWLLAGRQTQGDSPAASAVDALPLNRIAILYFRDESAAADSRSPLAAGLTEALIDRLGQVESLDVISTGGVRQFIGSSEPPTAIAQALGAGSLVTGTLFSSNGRLRIYFQMLDGSDGTVVERRMVERQVGELFALQDELAEELARVLRTRLGEQVALRQRRHETQSAEAWFLVQRAAEIRQNALQLRELADSASMNAFVQTLDAADSLLTEAEGHDADWFEPHLERGWSLWDLAEAARESSSERFVALMDAALVSAERALERSPGNARALYLRGALRAELARASQDSASIRGLEDARRDLQTAVNSDPGLAPAWNSLSLVLQLQGQFEQARLAAARALEEDAYLEAAGETLQRLFYVNLELGDFDQARNWCARGAADFVDDWRFAECRLVLAAYGGGPDLHADSARAILATAERLTPPEMRSYRRPSRLAMTAAVQTRAGDLEAAEATLAEARTAAGTDRELQTALLYEEAHIRVLAGEFERAVELLATYLAAKPHLRGYLANDEALSPLRGHPGFEELLRAP